MGISALIPVTFPGFPPFQACDHSDCNSYVKVLKWKYSALTRHFQQDVESAGILCTLPSAVPMKTYTSTAPTSQITASFTYHKNKSKIYQR